MRGVIAAATLVACGRGDFEVRVPADTVADANLDLLPWSAPQPIAQLNTSHYDADPTVTADQLELYFSSDRTPGLGKSDIYVSRRSAIDAPWGSASIVAELSSTDNDDSPEISPDGLTLWQATDRSSAYQIFVSTRATRSDAWSAPVLVPELSGNGGAQNLAVAPNGLVAVVEFFTSTNQGDLYELRRISPHDTWGQLGLIQELATADNESSPTLDAEGLTIYFTSNRPGSQGLYDIWMATRPSLAAPFATPVRVDALDSASDDGNPFLSPDGHAMYWASDRAPTEGVRDLWFATR